MPKIEGSVATTPALLQRLEWAQYLGGRTSIYQLRILGLTRVPGFWPTPKWAKLQQTSKQMAKISTLAKHQSLPIDNNRVQISTCPQAMVMVLMLIIYWDSIILELGFVHKCGIPQEMVLKSCKCKQMIFSWAGMRYPKQKSGIYQEHGIRFNFISTELYLGAKHVRFLQVFP